MIKYLTILTTALLLSACATTLRSDVTAFHEWPAQLQDKSYAFAAPPQINDTLEYRSYQNLVRLQLARLGFTEAASAGTANLTVSMNFWTAEQPVRVLQADPTFHSGFHGGYYGNSWGRSRWPGYGYGYGYGYSPFYDPFRYSQPVVREVVRYNYERQLQVTIDDNRGRKLFDVTVKNLSRVASTPAAMPALVASAFTDFPGRSGVARTVDLQLE
jgi:hypothetical protein